MAFPLPCTALNPLFSSSSSSLFPLGLGWSFLLVQWNSISLFHCCSQLENEPKVPHSPGQLCFQILSSKVGLGSSRAPRVCLLL